MQANTEKDARAGNVDIFVVIVLGIGANVFYLRLESYTFDAKLDTGHDLKRHPGRIATDGRPTDVGPGTANARANKRLDAPVGTEVFLRVEEDLQDIDIMLGAQAGCGEFGRIADHLPADGNRVGQLIQALNRIDTRGLIIEAAIDAKKRLNVVGERERAGFEY